VLISNPSIEFKFERQLQISDLGQYPQWHLANLMKRRVHNLQREAAKMAKAANQLDIELLNLLVKLFTEHNMYSVHAIHK